MVKKGQMESGELLMVLIVLVFIIVIAGVFLINMYSKSLGEQAQLYEDVESVQLAKRVASLPLVACDDAGRTQYGCVDRLKLQAFSDALRDEKVGGYAIETFGHASVSLVILTGSHRQTEHVYSSPYDKSESQVFTYPVLVHNPLSGGYSFGYWNITRYRRNT